MTQKLSSPSLSRAHFVGIGGIGISALARWFLAENWTVTGSDVSSSLIIDSLKKAGILVKIGHSRANLPLKGLNMVIYSPAISQNNPELVEAKKRGIKPLSYPEALGCLSRLYKTIAISGTHGKSTTTSMAALALPGKNFSPTVVVGTNLKEFGNSNFRKGKDKWLIMEADEWKASFLNYSPLITVVTTVDADHLDFYKNLAEIKKTFLKFMERTQEGGALVLNREDKNLRSMESAILKISKKLDLEVIWYSKKDLPNKNVLSVPGEHNVLNAAAVLGVAKVIGVKKNLVLKGLRSYEGSWRRMEFRGFGKIGNIKCRVYDDYAHHPTEIKATLQAFKEKFPNQKLVCVYQPHQAKRLKSLFKEFVSAFLSADCLVLFPVYEVSGRDKATSNFSSEVLAQTIIKKYRGFSGGYLAEPKKLKGELRAIFEYLGYKSEVVIVMMGAGDIIKYTPLLL